MSSILSSSSLSILSMDLCFGVQSTTSSFISSNSSSSSSMAVIELVLSDQDDNNNDNTQPSQPSQSSKSPQSSETHSTWSHSSTQSLSDHTYGSNSVAYIHYNVPRSSNPFTTKQSIPKPTISNPFTLRTPSISISPIIQNSQTEKIAAYAAFCNEQKSDISCANKSRKDKLLSDLFQPPEKTLKQKIAESRTFFGVQSTHDPAALRKHGLHTINAKNMRPSRPKPPNHRFNYFTSKSDAFIDGEDDEYPALTPHNIKSNVFVKSGHNCHVSYFSWDNDKMVNDILLGGDRYQNKRKFCFV